MRSYVGTIEGLAVELVPAYLRRFKCQQCGNVAFGEQDFCLNCDKLDLYKFEDTPIYED